MVAVIVTVVTMALLGTGIGVLTGLTPGLHVNTMALLLLSASGPLYAALGGGFGIAVIIASAATAHTFLDFIPSAFLGVPEEDTALVVLPAHSMVQEGRGFEAVCLSAVGSGLALLMGVAMLLPFRFVFIDTGIYPVLRENIVTVLVGLCIVLTLTERGGRPEQWWYGPSAGTVVLLLSGLFGLVVLEVEPCPLMPLPGNILFPVLSGVFGVPPLIEAMRSSSSVPPQTIGAPTLSPATTACSVATGTVGGSLLGFLPGMSSAHATVLSMLARGERHVEQVIVTLSSVNTANAFYAIMALFVIGRGRSGAAIAIREVVETPLWTDAPPPVMLHIIAAVLLAGAVSFVLTVILGKMAARTFSRIPYRAMNAAIFVTIVLLVLLFTGAIGLAVLAVGALVGQVPVELGVRRSHAMGVLLIPVIVYLM